MKFCLNLNPNGPPDSADRCPTRSSIAHRTSSKAPTVGPDIDRVVTAASRKPSHRVSKSSVPVGAKVRNVWTKYLDGKITRDDAVDQLVAWTIEKAK